MRSQYGINEMSEFLHHFDNLTFFVNVAGGSKTNLMHNEAFPESSPESHCNQKGVQWYYKNRLNTVGGSVAAKTKSPFPIISSAKIKGCHGDIFGPTLFEDLVRKPCPIVLSWEQKTNAVFWRGGDTGGGMAITGNNTGVRARVKSALKMIKSPAIDVDFNYIDYKKCDNSINVKNCRGNHTKTGMGLCMHQKFAYLLDIDGNSNSRRFPTLMTAGSCLLRFHRYRMWSDDFFVPGKHYVELPWAALDDSKRLQASIPSREKAEKIAEEGRKMSLFVQEDGAHCYFFRLLLRYADLFGLPLRSVEL